MKTDETNLVKHEIPFVQKTGVSAYAGVAATHLKSPAEREQDALDAWRDRQAKGEHDKDPIEIHQLDLDSAEPKARAALQAFTETLKHLQDALQAADRRLAWTEDERHHDPDTRLLRHDTLLAEIRHLEMLDRQEGRSSEIALLRIVGFGRFREKAGRANAERAMVTLGKALRAALDDSEPAGRIGDGEFLVLLTGLAGTTAEERTVALARAIVAEIDKSSDTVDLRPGEVSIGQAVLGPREDPMEALARADRDSN
ncbi:MAG: diguanylate cyclase [Alphaproteobacteria bacterium]|nr:diguanylate cyclase [Alphaproteobacteria bacterium]